MSIQNAPTAADAEVAPRIPAPQERRIWLPFHFALGAALILLVFAFNRPDVSDPDIWWHLNNAQLILAGHFPRVDTFSWTAKGSPWMDHEWLSEIPYYLSYRAGGLRGLYAISFLLSSLTLCLILYRAAKLSSDAKNSFVVAVYCVLLTVVSFGPRTLIFGWIYLLIMLIALDKFREGHEKAVWIIPPLFLLWVNCHGSWMIGLVIYAIIAGSGLFEFQYGQIETYRWSPRQLRLLIIVGVLSVLALFVNPYGYKLVAYPFDMAFRQKLNIQYVEEWASVDFHNARGKVVFLGLVAAFICSFFSKKKVLLADLLLLVLALYSGLTYVRFLFLFAILVSPFLSARIHLFPPYDPKIDKPLMNLLFGLVVLGIVVWRFPTEAKLNADLQKNFPSNTSITYLKDHNVRDKVLTQYLWGGYLERFFPELPVFIDSRVDIFEYNGTLKDYLDLIAIKDPLAVLDRRKIQYVYFQPNEPLVYLLRRTGGWDVLYEDKTAVLLKRH
ncbi:MAG: hypothetical protein ROO76_13505 [Terriglobia bacterium]|nr:hypothetical protein [Terriglobia bacterium]